MGVSDNRGTLLGGSYNKGFCTWGYISGTPGFAFFACCFGWGGGGGLGGVGGAGMPFHAKIKDAEKAER